MRPPSPGPVERSRRLDSLTGLRFVAALAVVLSHIWGEMRDSTTGRALAPVSRAGFAGVLFFFVLSGFVLAWSARPGVLPFYRRRLARVYPVYLLSLVVGSISYLWIEGGHLRLPVVVAESTMVQTWILDAGPYNALNPPGWSLSAEVFFYLLFPLLLPVVLRLGRAQAALVAVVATAAVVVSGVLADVPWGVQPSGLVTVLGRLPALLVGAFVLGLLAARAVREQWLPVIPLPVALALGAIGYLVACNLPSNGALNTITIVPMSLLVVAAAQRDLAGLPSIWSRRVLCELGAASYCLYLFHWPVMRMLAWPGFGLSHAEQAAATLLAAIPLSLLVHGWVERPLEKVLRGGTRSAANQVQPAVAVTS